MFDLIQFDQCSTLLALCNMSISCCSCQTHVRLHISLVVGMGVREHFELNKQLHAIIGHCVDKHDCHYSGRVCVCVTETERHVVKTILRPLIAASGINFKVVA